MVDLPQTTLVDGRAEELVVLAEPVLVADRELLARALRGRDHVARLLSRDRHGLLAHHVLARLERGDRDLTVRDVPGADVDHIEARVVHDVVPVRGDVRVRGSIPLAGLLGTLLDQVAERDDVNLVRDGCEARQVLAHPDEPEPDDPYAQFGHVSFSFVDVVRTTSTRPR